VWETCLACALALPAPGSLHTNDETDLRHGAKSDVSSYLSLTWSSAQSVLHQLGHSRLTASSFLITRASNLDK
jgi:hypothetical protein